jgi:hypothetical protein
LSDGIEGIMPDNLEIERVGLPEVDRERMSSVMRRSGVRWYSLTVSVKNTSEETTLYAISDVRRIHYDASRRALLLHFSEHETPAELQTVGIPLPPRYIAVRPGEAAVLTYQLSSPITFVEQPASGEATMSHVAIPDDVDTIECTVAYGTSPPAQRFNLTSREEAPRAQWRNWGTTVEASLRPPRMAGQETSH